MFYITNYTKSEALGTLSSVEFFSDLENLLDMLSGYLIAAEKKISHISYKNAVLKTLKTNVPRDAEQIDDFIKHYNEIINSENSKKNGVDFLALYIEVIINDEHYTIIKTGTVEDGKYVSIV